MDRLEPCPSCQRHVRVSESSCPFCGTDVRALSALPERAMPAARLGRAALFAFGVTAAAATAGVVGCADEPDPDVDEDGDNANGHPLASKDAGEGAKDAGGSSTDPAPSKDAGGVVQRDAGTVVALYGLAVPGGLQGGGGQPGGAFIPDAGERDAGASDAGRKKDAGPGGDLGGAVALYGLAPAPPGSDLKDGGIIRRDAGGIVPLYGLAVPATDEQSTES